MRNLETESYHRVFPSTDSCAPNTFQNAPFKTLGFLLLLVHFSPLCYFLLSRKVLLLDTSCFLSHQLQGRFFHTCSQVQPTKKQLWRKKSVWCTLFNRSIPTHFTLYCILSSHSLFWRSHTSYCSHSFPSSTHWAPAALTHHWHLLYSAVYPSPLYEHTGMLLYLTAACSMHLPFHSSTRLHLLQISASDEASELLPDTFNTITSSSLLSTSTRVLFLRCSVLGSMATPQFWPSEADRVLFRSTSFFFFWHCLPPCV